MCIRKQYNDQHQMKQPNSKITYHGYGWFYTRYKKDESK